MKKKLSECQLILAKKGITLIVVLAVLIIAIAAFSSNRSFGWFSLSKEISASGIQVNPDRATFDVYYRLEGETDWTLIDLSQPISLSDAISAPGSIAVIEVKIINNSNRPVELREFGIAAPLDLEEVANQAGVYLSTELYTTVSQVSNARGDSFLLDSPPPLSKDGVALSVGKIDYMQYVSSSRPIILALDEYIVFKISVMFLNRETSQNAFKNFGVNGDGVCSRRLYFTYNDQ